MISRICLLFVLLTGIGSLSIAGGKDRSQESSASGGAFKWQVYAGASLGAVDSDFSRDDDLGFKIFGGFNLNRNFALEGGYVNFGDEIGNQGQDTFYITAVGIAPINSQVSLFGKLGFHAWDDEVSNQDGTDLTWGIGVSYKLNSTTSVRLEHESFNDIGGDDLSLTSVGIAISFN